MTSAYFSSALEASQSGINQIFATHPDNPIFRNNTTNDENIAIGEYYIRRSASSADGIVLVINTNDAQRPVRSYIIHVTNETGELQLCNITINGISLSNRDPAITTIAQLLSVLDSEVIPAIEPAANNAPDYVN